ncbi:MAG: MATE family efflux transporter [Treponema sp.]|nr:MATE family efflux transporter [Treponema sp.]
MEKSQQSNSYLITESVGTLLPKFAIPCVVSLIISCLYNIVDQIFVGRSTGYLGNAATGIIFPITVVGWGVALLFGDGAAAYLSIAQGRCDTKSAGKTIANSVLFSFLTGVLLILACYFFGDPILRVLGATDATIGLARDYGYIVFMMIPLAMAQLTVASIIRADGSPSYAMMTMAVGAVINIVFDAITIFVWGWGIKGAAFATIFGQFVSFVLCALYLRRSKNFRIGLSDFIPDGKAIKPVLPLGGSSFLTQISIVVVTVVSNKLLVTYGALSEYGPDIPLAAFVVIMKLFQIVLCIGIGIAAGAQPVIGFNYGAKRYDRVKATFKYVLLWTFITSAVATALFQAIPLTFIRLFGADGELYTAFAVKCLRVYLSLIILTCVQKAGAIFLQSIGKAGAAIPLAMMRDVVFLMVFSAIFSDYAGVTGIFWAAPAADILAIIITVVVLARVWKQLGAVHAATGGPSEAGVSPVQPSRKGVIVAISREHGSGGKRVGQLVAERLSIPFYYKEMTALAAEESGLASEFVSGINANSPAHIRELYLSTEVVREAIIAQEKIIRKIADNGSCVIVGRASDYVLREYEDVVRVFIHAPQAYRIKKVMEIYGDSEQEGKTSITRSDAARAAYYKNISGADWGNARHYELCVNSSIGAENTAAAICEYIKQRS